MDKFFNNAIKLPMAAGHKTRTESAREWEREKEKGREKWERDGDSKAQGRNVDETKILPTIC